MTAAADMPLRLTPTSEQRRASDPRRSVWVTANAGTGKTRVLTDRVLRLLLTGADPESVLCLTFTKAAATEMTERIEARLAGWATSDDATLAAELEDLEGAAPAKAMVERARGLFARVLDLPQGLPIMTLHAMATSLLRRFPLEAGVPPHFETVDERTGAELLIEARQSVLTAAATDPDGPLGRAFATLVMMLNETSLTEAIREILDDRVKLAAALARFPGTADERLDALLCEVRRALNLEPEHTYESLVARACAEGEHDVHALLPAANALLQGSEKTDQPRGRALLRWLDATPADRARMFEEHCACFLTSTLAPRAESHLSTNQVDAIHRRPLLREQGRLVELCERLKAVRIAEATEAVLRVGVAALAAYDELKSRRAGLDYDDLIERACELLEKPGGADWVLFKLDARLEHILVDEAQDTSPRQWAIIERLVDEFFAGQGAQASPRTLFVVGDEKQSIYSFQGADLANFQAVRARLRERAAGALAEVGIELSFRSGPAILDCVDAVFADPAARDGVLEPALQLRHTPFRRNAAGTVEIWPLLAPPEGEDEDEPWPLPEARPATDNASLRLARAIAERIAAALGSGELLESEGRPIRPGDVLVLLGRRGILQELLIRALRRRAIPVAGADRLALTDHIAVQDLMALGRIALLPEDDLSLAAVAKSPLIGLSEEALYELAHDRGQSSLLERLRALAGEKPPVFAAAYQRLATWLATADFMPPFEFFASVLNEAGPDGRTARHDMLARLGPEAAEPLDAFLGQSLAYEQGHPASLQGFIHWLEAGSKELKRDPEQAGDAVRVMTVHGSKGLESPIVILADAGPRSEPARGKLVWDNRRLLPFWRGNAKSRDDATELLCGEETRRSQEERRRLLYVALTRARDRLYIAGCAGKGSRDAGKRPASWHDHVLAGLAQLADVEAIELAPPLEGKAQRYRRGAASALRTHAVQPQAEPPGLPDWARRPALPETAATALAPSRLVASENRAEAAGAGGGEGQEEALAVGTFVHRLLELLPDLSALEREAAMQRFLAQRARGFAPELRERIAAAARRILDHPELVPVFGPAGRAEQAIAGRLGQQHFGGQIDRLAVGRDAILLVDFKTNRRPPARAEAAPAAYLRQMAVYRALLARTYPGRPVRCALVWTETGDVMWLPSGLLDASLADLGIS